jgi:hypothetical protein
MGACRPFADRQPEKPLSNKERELKRVEQPFKEVGRTKMGDGETGPIEDLFSDKGVPTRIAFRIPIGRSLGQIDDGGHARFPGGLREIDSRIDKPRRDRVDQIGRLYAFHGLADRIDIVEVAYDDFGTEFFQGGRSIVLPCTMARTLSPSTIDALTAARPVSPVAPVINTLRLISCSYTGGVIRRAALGVAGLVAMGTRRGVVLWVCTGGQVACARSTGCP